MFFLQGARDILRTLIILTSRHQDKASSLVDLRRRYIDFAAIITLT